MSAPAEVKPRKLPKVAPEHFERVLDEVADTLRKARVPGRKATEWIPWPRLSEGLKHEWREEAMLIMFTTTQLLYGDNIKVVRGV